MIRKTIRMVVIWYRLRALKMIIQSRTARIGSTTASTSASGSITPALATADECSESVRALLA